MLLALALAGLGLLPSVFWGGGIVEREATVFIPRYLDGRGLAQKVFDPRTNDFGLYQARELSHFVDLLDAHAVAAARRVLGVAAFTPLSALVSSLVLIAVVAAGAARAAPRLSPVSALLALAVFMSQFAYAATAGVYYRSTKALVCPLLLALLFRVVAEARGTVTAARRVSWPVLALALALGLADRPGFFLAFGVLLVGLAAQARGARLRQALAALGIALGLLVVYDVLLERVAVWWLNGYWPALSFQRLSPRTLWREPERLQQSVELLAGSARLMAGSLPGWACALAALLGLAWFRWRRWSFSPTALLLAALAAAGLWAIEAGLIARHWPIYTHSDHRLWYYPLPFQATILFGLVLGLEALEARSPVAGAWGIPFVLLALTVANLALWPSYRQALRQGPWFPRVEEQTTRLKESLARGAPAPGLDPDYLRLFEWLRRIPPG